MKTSMKTLSGMLALIMLLVMCVTVLTACGDDTPAVIDPVDDTGFATRTTIATPQGQMTFNDAVGMAAPTIAWSRLKLFTHTDEGDGKATFTVADGYGLECTLNVTYDEANDTVTQADLVYGDISASILTDDPMALLDVLEALETARTTEAE